MRHAARARKQIHAAAPGKHVASIGTATLHVLVGVVLFGVPRAAGREAPPVYRIELVAAPRPKPQARRAPQAVERPAERAAPTQRPRRTSVAETPPPPEAEPAVEREPAPRTTPEAEPLPDEEPSTGDDPATVRVEGQAFQYPEYLRNIVAQIYRRWQRPAGNAALLADVQFLIHRDGSISNMRFVRRSGSYGFDLEAQGAIEAAANAGAFGPLPAGYPNDVLLVNFFFDPTQVR